MQTMYRMMTTVLLLAALVVHGVWATDSPSVVRVTVDRQAVPQAESQGGSSKADGPDRFVYSVEVLTADDGKPLPDGSTWTCRINRINEDGSLGPVVASGVQGIDEDFVWMIDSSVPAGEYRGSGRLSDNDHDQWVPTEDVQAVVLVRIVSHVDGPQPGVFDPIVLHQLDRMHYAAIQAQVIPRSRVQGLRWRIDGDLAQETLVFHPSIRVDPTAGTIERIVAIRPDPSDAWNMPRSQVGCVVVYDEELERFGVRDSRDLELQKFMRDGAVAPANDPVRLTFSRNTGEVAGASYSDVSSAPEGNLSYGGRAVSNSGRTDGRTRYPGDRGAVDRAHGRNSNIVLRYRGINDRLTAHDRVMSVQIRAEGSVALSWEHHGPGRARPMRIKGGLSIGYRMEGQREYTALAIGDSDAVPGAGTASLGRLSAPGSAAGVAAALLIGPHGSPRQDVERVAVHLHDVGQAHRNAGEAVQSWDGVSAVMTHSGGVHAPGTQIFPVRAYVRQAVAAQVFDGSSRGRWQLDARAICTTWLDEEASCIIFIPLFGVDPWPFPRH